MPKNTNILHKQIESFKCYQKSRFDKKSRFERKELITEPAKRTRSMGDVNTQLPEFSMRRARMEEANRRILASQNKAPYQGVKYANGKWEAIWTIEGVQHFNGA